MIRIIGFNGVIGKSKEFSVKDGKSLTQVSNLFLGKLMDGEREKIMMILVKMFGRLRYEDLEEIYSDACMVLWKKMNEDGFELKDGSLVSFLIKTCRNIGLHYLRKVDNNLVSMDGMMSGDDVNVGEYEGLGDMFDVLDNDEYVEDEVYERLDSVWMKLSMVDRMILESYYWDGCKMEEIAYRVGYKSADGVKSRKNKVLRKMMEMMLSEEGGNLLPSSVFRGISVFYGKPLLGGEKCIFNITCPRYGHLPT